MMSCMVRLSKVFIPGHTRESLRRNIIYMMEHSRDRERITRDYLLYMAYVRPDLAMYLTISAHRGVSEKSMNMIMKEIEGWKN